MMGHIGFSPSYGETLGYCLQDKRISQEQTQHPTDLEHRQTRNRAEVLYYHHCYGDIRQLTRQFKEVQKQHLNVIKPAFHLSLSLPPGDNLSKSQFVDLAQDCAKALDFERHQYLVILHKDTPHPHVHVVVNRIGADKHLMTQTNMLKRIDQFCREAELKYQLTPVESMRRFQSPEERLRPSQGLRVVQLKEEITQTLKQAQDLASFKEQMQERGYKVHKTERGISFTDRDGVFTTGSKAEYPWRKIEATLAQNLAERQAQELRLEQERIRQQEIKQKLEIAPKQEPKLGIRRKPDFESDNEPEQVQRQGLRMRM
jgi:hypothetical protein